MENIIGKILYFWKYIKKIRVKNKLYPLFSFYITHKLFRGPIAPVPNKTLKQNLYIFVLEERYNLTYINISPLLSCWKKKKRRVIGLANQWFWICRRARMWIAESPGEVSFLASVQRTTRSFWRKLHHDWLKLYTPFKDMVWAIHFVKLN